MTNAILRGRSYAGNPHVRFDEGEVASYPPTVGRPEGVAMRGAKPRRGSLLYRRVLLLSLLVSLSAGATEYHVSPQGDDAAAGSADRPFRSLARARDAARTAGGTLFANGQRLLQVPFDAWFDVGLEFELGKDRKKKTFDVRVRLPGEEKARVFAGQPLAPNFTDMDWVGFTSNASGGQRYWLDDFRLIP